MDIHDAFLLHGHTHSIHKNDRIEQPSLSTAHKNAHQGTLSHMQLLGRDGEEGWEETGKKWNEWKRYLQSHGFQSNGFLQNIDSYVLFICEDRCDLLGPCSLIQAL